MQKPSSSEDILQKLETIDVNSLSPEELLVFMQLADQVIEASHIEMGEALGLDQQTLEVLRNAQMDGAG